MTSRTTPEAEALHAAMNRYRATLSDGPVRSVLMGNGRLLGPRGVLESAAAFAEEVATRASLEPAPWWDLCRALAAISARRAPAGDPGEFAAFCGTLGASAVACVVDEHTTDALELARAAARDPRWRLREAAAMAYQRLLLARRKPALAALRALLEDGRALELRAVVAALAEPAVLAVPELADAAVDLHRQVVERLLASPSRSAEAARTLRQALGYSIAVVAMARPDQGFALLRDLIARGDADGLWIVRENLGRARLRERFPERVAELERTFRFVRS